jgi:hypothetical protein
MMGYRWCDEEREKILCLLGRLRAPRFDNPLSRNSHALVGLIALGRSRCLSLTVLSLLVLLNEIAATTAACSGEVDEAAALEVVLLTEVGALEGERNPVKTDAGGTPEEEALLDEVLASIDAWCWGIRTEVLMGS